MTTDTDRLDYLARNELGLWLTAGTRAWQVYRWADQGAYREVFGEANAAREAIDSAMGCWPALPENTEANSHE